MHKNWLTVLRRAHCSIGYWPVPRTFLKKSNHIEAVLKSQNFKDLILRENISEHMWETERRRLLKEHITTLQIVDATIIKSCLLENKVDSAISYMQFLKNRSYDMNTAMWGFKLCLYRLKSSPLTESEEEDIITTYKYLKEMHPQFDEQTAYNCIMGLCATKQWKESYKLLDDINESVTLQRAYSVLIIAAFLNNEHDIAYDHIDQMINKGLYPVDSVYIAHLNLWKKSDRSVFNREIEKMLKLWEKHKIILTPEVVSEYINVCNSFGWSAQYTKISLRGECLHCKQILSKKEISQSETRLLLETLHDVIIPSAFSKIGQERMRQFLRFIYAKIPFKYVIDGQNVHYARQNFVSLVKRLARDGQRILVVYKNCIFKTADVREFVTNNDLKHVYFYNIRDGENDDIYVLYATLASGRGSKFLSNDLMRNHMHVITNNYILQLFKQWQMEHQMQQLNHSCLEDADAYTSCVQSNGNNWHVPFTDVNNTVKSSAYITEQKEWACLSYKEQTT